MPPPSVTSPPVGHDAVRAGGNRVRPVVVVALAVVALGLVATLVAGVYVGQKAVPLDRVLAAVTGQSVPADVAAIVDRRAVRTVVGLLCGAALAVAGALMQQISRNPLADPGILGVTAGAALGVAVSIALSGGAVGRFLPAVLGAGGACLAVWMFAGGPRLTSSPVQLLLGGVALSAVLTGLTQALVVSSAEVLEGFRFWRVATLSGPGTGELATGLPLILGGLLLALPLGRSLDGLALGDEAAAALGVRIGRVRTLALAAIALLCGAATALIGPLAFLGLAVPHVVAPLARGSVPRLLLWCVPVGGAGLVWTDLAGRAVLEHGELPVGLVTLVVGGPAMVLVLLLRVRGT